MKIRIDVSDERKEEVIQYLTGHGIEISEDADFIISEISDNTSFLSVRNDKKERISLSVDDVVYIESFGKEIEIHTENDVFHSQDRIYMLEQMLDPKIFLRVSKSVIISRKHVKKIRPSLSMKYILTMSDGTLIDVTRSYYSEFRRFFNI